jgi:hypothetical protein
MRSGTTLAPFAATTAASAALFESTVAGGLGGPMGLKGGGTGWLLFEDCASHSSSASDDGPGSASFDMFFFGVWIICREIGYLTETRSNLAIYPIQQLDSRFDSRVSFLVFSRGGPNGDASDAR